MNSVLPSNAPLTRGHKKKSRTRIQLLDAALGVLAESGEGFSIADVVSRAGVSHGTFYNYFADRDSLMAALGGYVVERFAAVAAREVDESDPARRFAQISARALAIAVTSPNLVRVALRVEVAQRALLLDGPLAYLREDILDGARIGRFLETPDDAAIDVVVGALLLAARRVLDGEVGPGYRSAVIRRLLLSLGLTGDEAARIAADVVVASERQATSS